MLQSHNKYNIKENKFRETQKKTHVIGQNILYLTERKDGLHATKIWKKKPYNGIVKQEWPICV